MANENQNMDILNEQQGVFAASVDAYKSKAKQKGNRKIKKRVSSILLSCFMLAVCFGIFCYSGYLIIMQTMENYFEEEQYDDIRVNPIAESVVKKVSKLAEPTNMLTMFETLNARESVEEYVIDTTEKNDEFKLYYQNYVAFHNKYPDAYAWIVMTGTNIDYPVMYSDDESYYLYHNYKKEQVKSGSIFLSEKTRSDYLSNYNLVTYGHDMANGTMYRGIKLWYDSSTRNTQAKDMYIYVYNEDGVYIYQLFSAYRATGVDFVREMFYSNSDYKSWLKSIYRKSVLKNKFSYDADTRIITMVTCTNAHDAPDERYVVHGIMVKKISAQELLSD